MDPQICRGNPRMITCVVEGCPATLKNNKWTVLRSGWFFNRDQQNVGYCPDHIPSWVHDWRKRKGEVDGC